MDFGPWFIDLAKRLFNVIYIPRAQLESRYISEWKLHVRSQLPCCVVDHVYTEF